MERITTTIAANLNPAFKSTRGKQGYVCAQVNPGRPGDVAEMIAMAGRFQSWAPNIAVKLPATKAGMEALEECSARGITCTMTVSFTVPQVIAIAECYRKGLARAKKDGVTAGRCFAVVMVGRLDDYLREVAMDQKYSVSETELKQAGLAVVKRAYALFREKGYEAVLLPAAMRGAYHPAGMAGAEMVLSIHPTIQAKLMDIEPPYEKRIDMPIQDSVIERLKTMPEFTRAYEPEGMSPKEFITFGLTQRTLSQFVEAGWKQLEAYNP